MGIPSVAILSRMIRLPVCRPGRGGKGIAPGPFVCWSAQHELATLRGDLRRGPDDYYAHTAGLVMLDSGTMRSRPPRRTSNRAQQGDWPERPFAPTITAVPAHQAVRVAIRRA